jgi:hypothetical protein
VVRVQVGHEDRPETTKMFRYLLLKYAPDFAAPFADPRITAITRKDITLNTMTYFSSWLHSCYECDREGDKDLWAAHAETPDWSSVECSCIYGDASAEDIKDPLHPEHNRHS